MAYETWNSVKIANIRIICVQWGLENAEVVTLCKIIQQEMLL